MKQALIVFHSKRGKTKKYAEKIGCFLNSMNIAANVIPIEMFRKDLLTSADFVLLGCWTNGLMLLNQKPEKIWIDFVKNLHLSHNQKVGLFTTYKILTGSMFLNMRKHLNHAAEHLVVELKSRNGRLSDVDKKRLKEFFQ